jgi:polo-like kinase 1
VDYSSKHGLGYSLNNGTIGVHFNDSSKMVGDPNNTVIEYYERVGDEKNDRFQVFNVDSYPAELKAKVSLLNHFRSFLESDLKDNHNNLKSTGPSPAGASN